MARVALSIALCVALWVAQRGVHEPLVALVAFTAAEENVGTLFPLHTLVAVEDMEGGNQKHINRRQTTTPGQIIFPRLIQYN